MFKQLNMSLKKLFPKKTKKLKDWTLTSNEIKILTRKAGKITTQKIKSPEFKIKQDEIRLLPTEFSHKDLIFPEIFWPKYFCLRKYRVRKNQKNLTPIEWNRFIHAIEALADSDMTVPTYQDFVQMHVNAMDTHAGHAWGAHTMPGHDGRNFLTWHREYLVKIENRLRIINPLVTIPYWNWIEDRTSIPAALTKSADLTRWGVTRGGGFNGASIATASDHANLMAINDFGTFSLTLERSPFHNRIHGLVGGTMSTSSSPADPLFWLHHSFIDKLFHDWQVLNPAATHPNPNEVLLPAPIMTRTNSEVWNILSLGYIYA